MIEPEINLIALFCYGSNNNEQVRRRVKNPNLISRPCILPFSEESLLEMCKDGMEELLL